MLQKSISCRAEELHKLLYKLDDKFGLTIVIVTHIKELAMLTNCVIEMKYGKKIYNYVKKVFIFAFSLQLFIIDNYCYEII